MMCDFNLFCLSIYVCHHIGTACFIENTNWYLQIVNCKCNTVKWVFQLPICVAPITVHSCATISAVYMRSGYVMAVTTVETTVMSSTVQVRESVYKHCQLQWNLFVANYLKNWLTAQIKCLVSRDLKLSWVVLIIQGMFSVKTDVVWEFSCVQDMWRREISL